MRKKSWLLILFSGILPVVLPAFSWTQTIDSTTQTYIYEQLESARTFGNAQVIDSALIYSELAMDSALQVPSTPDTTLARIYMATGWCYIATGQLDLADSLLTKALDIRIQEYGPDDTLVANVYADLGRVYFGQRRFAEGLPIFEKAAAIRNKMLPVDNYDRANSIGNLATIYIMFQRFDEADSLYQICLPMLINILGEDHLKVATTYRNMGIVYTDERDYARGIEYYQKALDIFKRVGGPEHPMVPNLLDNIAANFSNMGKYLKAEEYDLKAITLNEKLLGPDHLTVAVNLNNLAAIYFRLGRFTESIVIFKRALAIREKQLDPNNPLIADVVGNLATAYSRVGNYEKSLELQNRAMAINTAVNGPESPEVAINLQNIGVVYYDQHEYGKAIDVYQKSLEIREKAFGPDDEFVARSLNNLAQAYNEFYRFDDAIANNRRALAIFEAKFGPDNPEVALCAYGLGCSYRELRQFDTAETYLEQAYTTWSHNLEPFSPYLFICRNSMAKLFAAEGKWDQCRASYRDYLNAILLFFDYVYPASTEEQKIGLARKFTPIPNALVTLGVEGGDSLLQWLSFEAVINGKAKVLDAIIADNHTLQCSTDTTIERLLGERAAIRTLIANLASAGMTGGAEEDIGDSLRSLVDRQDSLEISLGSRCGEFKDRIRTRDIDAHSIAYDLPSGTVLWEFIKYNYDNPNRPIASEGQGEERYAAFILGNRDEFYIDDLGSAQTIDSLITVVRNEVAEAGNSAIPGFAVEDETNLNVCSRQLTQLLLEPLLELSSGAKHILVSPDGALSLIPFEILPLADGRYAIEDYQFSYLSSSRDILSFQSETPSETKTALLLGNPDFDCESAFLASDSGTDTGVDAMTNQELADFYPLIRSAGCLDADFTPLPYSLMEIQGIDRVFTHTGTYDVAMFRGKDATEDELKAVLTQSPSVVHLATHGFICLADDSADVPTNPLLRSGLALAGANHVLHDSTGRRPSSGEDGILTAYEVSQLNLVGTELAVISACNSRVGEVINGEGVMGLQRAFHNAGAKASLVSLWRVPDKETARLMTGFYESWLSGKTKSEALRESALVLLRQLREQKGHGHPYFWGGFVLTGNPN